MREGADSRIYGNTFYFQTKKIISLVNVVSLNQEIFAKLFIYKMYLVQFSK